MRVVYNDRTPLEYTPKHFEEALSSDTSDSSQDTYIGSVTTPHHIFRLKVNNARNLADSEEAPSEAIVQSVCFSVSFDSHHFQMEEETYDEKPIEEIVAQIVPLLTDNIKTFTRLESAISSHFPRLSRSDLEGKPSLELTS